MSRTYNTRPMWVQHNDPRNKPVRISHEHRVSLREPVGEEEYETHWAPGTTRVRTLYRYWSEPVDCTIDVPEKTTSSWRFHYPRVETNEDKLETKHCFTYLRYYPENWSSHKEMKRLTNRALRAKINQQMHMAVQDQGGHCETDPGAELDLENGIYEELPCWWDVDIHSDSKYASYSWWD